MLNISIFDQTCYFYLIVHFQNKWINWLWNQLQLFIKTDNPSTVTITSPIMKMKNKKSYLLYTVFTSSENKNSVKRQLQYTTISLTNYSEVSEPSSSSSSAVRNTLMSRGEPAEAPLGTSTVVVISLSTITLSWVQYLKCSKEENTTPISVLYTFYYSYTTQRLYSLSYITTTYSVFSCNKKQLLLVVLKRRAPPNIFPAAIFTAAAPLCLQTVQFIPCLSIDRTSHN